MPDQDRTGPRKSSAMYKAGNRGRLAGHKQGQC